MRNVFFGLAIDFLELLCLGAFLFAIYVFASSIGG